MTVTLFFGMVLAQARGMFAKLTRYNYSPKE
jgi:hypothetical protein